MWKLLRFFIFNSVIPFGDVLSDFVTFLALYHQDHPNWSIITFFLMWNPFLINLVVFSYEHIKAKKTKEPFATSTKLRDVFLHLPLVLILKNSYKTYQLYRLRFDMTDFNSKNQKEVEEIQYEAGITSLYEAFTESGPQAVVQLIIVFSTGHISMAQRFSIPMSLLCIAWASSRAYFIQRGLDDADPAPETKTIILHILPWMFLAALNSVILWTIIGGLMGGYSLYGLLICFLTVFWTHHVVEWRMETGSASEASIVLTQAYLVTSIYVFIGLSAHFLDSCTRRGIRVFLLLCVVLFGFNKVRRWLKRQRSKQRDDRDQVHSALESQEDPSLERNSHFKATSALTAIWLPCVVGTKPNMFITAVTISLLNKLLFLALAVFLNYSGKLDGNVFLLWCREEENAKGLKDNNTELCDSMKACFSGIWNISEATWKVENRNMIHEMLNEMIHEKPKLVQLIRKCDERGDHDLQLYILLVIGISSVLSLVAAYKLHLVIDYESLYEKTKSLCNLTEPVVHRGLLMKLASEDKHEKLDEVLQTQNTSLMVNRARRGETALHLSASHKCTEVLLRNEAVPKENNKGRIPEVAHLLDKFNTFDTFMKSLKKKELEQQTVIKMLNLKNSFGKTPMEMAKLQPTLLRYQLMLALANGSDSSLVIPDSILPQVQEACFPPPQPNYYGFPKLQGAFKAILGA